MGKLDKLVKSMGSKVIKPIGGKDGLKENAGRNLTPEQREKIKETNRQFLISQGKHLIEKADQ